MAPDEVVAQKAEELGLNDPIPVQYFRYLGGMIQGDLGQSFVRPASGATMGGSAYDDATRSDRAEVLPLILRYLPYSLQLTALALLFALIISIPMGMYAGLNPGRWPDKLAFYTGSLFVSVPNFWLAIILIMVISANLGWLPAIGYRHFGYAILPAIVLAVEIAPFIIRTISVSMTQIMHEYFIESGLVRGLGKKRIIFFHGLRNASVPLLNVLGIQFSTLLGGVVVVEFVFDYPGIGLLTIQAVLQRDFAVIQGIAILTAALFVFINIIVDVAAAAIDPRLEDA
jgi:peptide/nickel transport system permease protein